MTYETIIETIREIVNNDLIYKEGLTLVYSIDETIHGKLNEHFYYQTNGSDNGNFESTDEFEVEIGGIIIKFIKNEKE